MGLLQRAVETYDANAALIGVYREGREPLAPIGHILTNADIEITLNAEGGFLTARRVEKGEPKVLIPVTEESGGRTTSAVRAVKICRPRQPERARALSFIAAGVAGVRAYPSLSFRRFHLCRKRNRSGRPCKMRRACFG